MISEQPMSYAEIVDALRAAGCVFAEDEAQLLITAAREADFDASQLRSLVGRRVAGAPLEPLIGWAEFCGLRVAVEPGVFVPRRRTEFLVEQAGELARVLASDQGPRHDAAAASRPVVVDLCCGTGAIGLAVLAALAKLPVLKSASLHACDIDPVAVRCAAQNIAPVAGITYQGDLFDALPAELCGDVDVIVCNAPYVPTDSIAFMPPEARDHEPRLALDGGADGVAIHRRVARVARQWLRPGGSLLIETSRSQATETQLAMQLGGLAARIARSDEYDATVAIGTRDRQDDPHAAVG